MDPDAERTVRLLAERVKGLLSRQDGPVLIGIAGAPGAGKSTLATLVARALGMERSIVIPMDGFHLAQSVIAGTALAERRGAIDTFDGWGYLRLLERIASSESRPIYAPEFRRSIEDPVPGAIEIGPEIQVVLTEGNYLLVDADPWQRIPRLLAETWYVETDDALRVQRLIARHVQFGKSPAEAAAWVAGPDEANARFIQGTRGRATHVVRW